MIKGANNYKRCRGVSPNRFENFQQLMNFGDHAVWLIVTLKNVIWIWILNNWLHFHTSLPIRTNGEQFWKKIRKLFLVPLTVNDFENQWTVFGLLCCFCNFTWKWIFYFTRKWNVNFFLPWIFEFWLKCYVVFKVIWILLCSIKWKLCIMMFNWLQTMGARKIKNS